MMIYYLIKTSFTQRWPPAGTTSTSVSARLHPSTLVIAWVYLVTCFSTTLGKVGVVATRGSLFIGFNSAVRSATVNLQHLGGFYVWQSCTISNWQFTCTRHDLSSDYTKFTCTLRQVVQVSKKKLKSDLDSIYISKFLKKDISKPTNLVDDETNSDQQKAVQRTFQFILRQSWERRGNVSRL